jgi:hypothetical protein
MKELFPILLLALAGVVAYHSATQGRRGRLWGRFKKS